MSNLYKSSWIVNTGEPVKRVIDSNEKVMERLEAIREQMEATPVFEEDGFISGIEAEEVEVLVGDDIEIDPDELLRRAKEESGEILHSAKLEADNLINNAQLKVNELREEAKKEGYAMGMSEAKAEIDREIAKHEAMYNQKVAEVKAEYEKMKEELEPQLVDTLLTVLTKVTHTLADSSKDTILNLVQNVMRNSEISREFLIKVSNEDYTFMINNREKLYEHVSQNVRIEIAQDNTLKRNQCIIETDAGVFDCSLDIQLENLVKEIRLLSCLVE